MKTKCKENDHFIAADPLEIYSQYIIQWTIDAIVAYGDYSRNEARKFAKLYDLGVDKSPEVNRSSHKHFSTNYTSWQVSIVNNYRFYLFDCLQ